MKIYVVYEGYDYEGHSPPEIAFLDREQAIKYAKSKLKGASKYYSAFVDEFDFGEGGKAVGKEIFEEAGNG